MVNGISSNLTSQVVPFGAVPATTSRSLGPIDEAFFRSAPGSYESGFQDHPRTGVANAFAGLTSPHRLHSVAMPLAVSLFPVAPPALAHCVASIVLFCEAGMDICSDVVRARNLSSEDTERIASDSRKDWYSIFRQRIGRREYFLPLIVWGLMPCLFDISVIGGAAGLFSVLGEAATARFLQGRIDREYHRRLAESETPFVR